MNGEATLFVDGNDHPDVRIGQGNAGWDRTVTGPVGLFPCLRRGSDRWWLPRSGRATEAMGHLMLAQSRAQIDESTRMRVQRALESEPTLLIFAALNWPGDRVDTVELVDWLAANLVNRFASGDAFLGAPAVTQSMRSRWNKLADHFRTVPFERWLDDAHLWLEVTGPQVSTAWRQQWPTLTKGSNGVPEALETTSDCMLQQLARTMQRLQSFDDAFSDRLQRTKLASIRQLAYGLSHEINNPLANISTRAQQLMFDEDDDVRRATLQRIVDQVYRAHQMIADLMFYANPPQTQIERHDLNSIVESVVATFRDEAERQEIRLKLTVPTDPTPSSVDRIMIAEAIRVLIRNAVEAIGSQGTIVVSVARNSKDVRIHVADSGPGLSDEARKHAFDPYYSGREAGRGLGLGLCRAYRITKLHHGDIRLAGGPAGCVATISLPSDS